MNSGDVVYIPLKDLEDNPYQARLEYDPSAIDALAVSIRENGLWQLPVVRRAGAKYQIVFGHRRKKAFEQLFRNGLKEYETMPCRVQSLPDRQMFEIHITENIKRQDLNPIEKARAMKRYMAEFGATSVQAAELFAVNHNTVRGLVRLLKLPAPDQEKVAQRKLSQEKAREILRRVEKKVQLHNKSVEFDLRRELLALIFGDPQKDINDRALFAAVKNVFERNKQMDRQIAVMNQRRIEGHRGVQP